MTRTKVVLGLVVLVLGLLGTGTVPTTSGRLTGKVTNPTNTVRTAVYGSTSTCAAAATATSGGGAYVVYPLTESSGPTATNATAAGGRNGTYSSSGVTYGAPGPCPRDGFRAVTLDGSAGFVQGPTTSAFTTFSLQVWFRTTTTRGGRLGGFGSGSLLTETSLQTDRQVYLTDAGRLVLGVNPGTPRTVQSPAAYNDGAWHHVVGVYAPSGAQQGLRLYVDGAVVATDTAAGGAAVYALGGMWRFGFDAITTGWPSRPTSNHFAGSIASAAVWSTALTATEVATLHGAGR